MNKEVEKAAKRAISRPLVNAPSLVRDDAGPSGAAPSTVLTFGTDFNEDDISDGGDVTNGTISPGTFLRMASGVSRAETEKPLPPLPSSVSCLFIPALNFRSSCSSLFIRRWQVYNRSEHVLTWIVCPDAAPAA